MSLESPRPPMPSLNALRALEAAARHESFVNAAQELHVTPGAVAQQVKIIESWLKKSLFYRHPHGVRLTREARTVLPFLTAAFNELGTAIHMLQDVGRPTEIRIAALPSVAMLWLMPRLTRLYQDFPNLNISVSAEEEPPDFHRDQYDLALFFANEQVTSAESFLMAEDVLFPVCSPKLLEKEPINSLSDLSEHTLIHDSMWSDDWDAWLSRVGMESIIPVNSLTFSLYSLALQATIEGNGILIGHKALVSCSLEKQVLVSPFPELQLKGIPLKLLAPIKVKREKHTRDLMAWLLREGQQDRKV